MFLQIYISDVLYNILMFYNNFNKSYNFAVVDFDEENSWDEVT